MKLFGVVKCGDSIEYKFYYFDCDFEYFDSFEFTFYNYIYNPHAGVSALHKPQTFKIQSLSTQQQRKPDIRIIR